MTASIDEQPLRAAADAGRFAEVATAALRAYGPEILDYVCALGRSEADGNEAFSQFTEDLWKGLPAFRWESSLKTWCYAVARHAFLRVVKQAHRKRGRRIALDDAPEVAALAEQVRSQTMPHLRTEVKAKVAALRASLTEEDQAILILRIDRKLAWRDVARALVEEGETVREAELTRRSAALRKRFERIKEQLRALASEVGE